jgi:hypothetical protein
MSGAASLVLRADGAAVGSRFAERGDVRRACSACGEPTWVPPWYRDVPHVRCDLCALLDELASARTDPP